MGCLRDAYDELLKKEALEQCEDSCRNKWIAESASLYATWLSFSLGCLAWGSPVAQIACELWAMANFEYNYLKDSKAAEDCVDDCEELYS